MSAYIKKDRKISNQWPNAASQTPKKQEQAKPKTNRRRDIIKIRATFNEMETKKKKYKESMIKKLVLWKNKQGWQTPGKSD
jgi:hypothetical protein